MRISLTTENLAALCFIGILVFCLSCDPPKDEKLSGSPTPESAVASPSPSGDLPTPTQKPSNAQVTLSADGFSADGVCSLPAQIAGGSPFTKLGGGKWEKWDDQGGEMDHSCNGGHDSVKLEQQIAKISASYSVLGNAQAAHYISFRYSSLQYGGKTPVGEQLKQQYMDFCDAMSLKLYGQKLPEKFRKNLADESAYSSTSTASEHHEKIGNGYANVSTSKDKDLMFNLEVRFFASEAEYKKYKDS